MKTGLQTRKEKIRLVAAAGLGNFLEFFEFGVYSLFAIVIGDLFFPHDNPSVSLLISVSVFGAGFVARPLGSILLGAYADRKGRKSAMLVTIYVMALGSSVIAFAPPYAAIGIAAPVLIVVGRLLQGFSAGAEAGVATSLLAESALDGEKGKFVSWQFITQASASVTGAAFASFLFWALPKEQLYAWGWRIPFMFGLVILPVGLYIRRHIRETLEPSQAAGKHHPIGEILRRHPRQFIAVTGMVIPGTVMIYTVLKYMPLYLQQLTDIRPHLIYLATLLAYAIEAAGALTGGIIYDRIRNGKRFAIGILVLCAGLLSILFNSLSVLPLFFTALFMASFAMGLVAPVGSAMIAESFSPHIRTTAMATSYSFGVAIFGGTAQMIVTWLLAVSGGNPNAPLWYLGPMLFLGIIFYLMFREKPHDGAEVMRSDHIPHGMLSEHQLPVSARPVADIS